MKLLDFCSMINPNLNKNYKFREVIHLNSTDFQINDEKRTVKVNC